MGKGCKSSAYALKFESVVVAEFQAAQANSSLDLSKAKYGITRPCVVGKKNVNVRINPNNVIACEEIKPT
jgi:hypothetical protein